MTSTPRRSRRAVRPPGTVGGDESNLRSVLPAPSGSCGERAVVDTSGPRASSGRGPAGPAVPGRSLDDQDVGWGDQLDDSNDERLRRDKPPHW